MKKIYELMFLFIGACVVFTMASCNDYLNVDKYFYDQLTLDSAFAKRTYVEAWLANAYEPLNQITETCYTNNSDNPAWMSDDIIMYGSRNWQNGDYSASTNDDYSNDLLYKAYECIRKNSTFINNVDRCPELTLTEISDMKAQARFLRAYSYWALVRHFGPVPVIPEAGLDVDLSYEKLSLPRVSVDSVINFIDRDLTLAARSLPLTRTINNIGRPTKGAALALRARVLLWAASPLMNGNTELFDVVDNHGNKLISQTYNESKWARAAAAAKDVIDLDQYKIYTVAPSGNDTLSFMRPPYNAEYSNKDFPNGWKDVDPYLSYKSLFDGTLKASQNPELIFTRTYSGSDYAVNWSAQCMPKSLKGSNNMGVSLKQVNAYYMDNGESVTEAKANGYYKEDGFTARSDEQYNGGNMELPANVSLQYAHREPRFYASIAYNGRKWICSSANESAYRNQQIWYYREQPDGKQGFNEDNIPLSGIGCYKFTNDEDSWATGGTCEKRTENTIRYAEVLLIYAEAMNELTKSYEMKTYNGQEVTISRNIAAMHDCIKPIRVRAGLPDYSDAVYNNRDDFRTFLKHERQIELFGEDAFRYYDLRRWKDAEIEENQPFMGCNINITNETSHKQSFYKKTAITQVPKIFIRKMYLWPFPTTEMKRNVNLTQNPGW